MKKNNYNRGEIGFGTEILIFVVIIFVIWILAGGAKKSTTVEQKPFIIPLTDPAHPGQTYGPGELKNN